MADSHGSQITHRKAKRFKTEHERHDDNDKNNLDHGQRTGSPLSRQDTRGVCRVKSEQSTAISAHSDERNEISRKHRKLETHVVVKQLKHENKGQFDGHKVKLGLGQQFNVPVRYHPTDSNECSGVFSSVERKVFTQSATQLGPNEPGPSSGIKLDQKTGPGPSSGVKFDQKMGPGPSSGFKLDQKTGPSTDDVMIVTHNTNCVCKVKTEPNSTTISEKKRKEKRNKNGMHEVRKTSNSTDSDGDSYRDTRHDFDNGKGTRGHAYPTHDASFLHYLPADSQAPIKVKREDPENKSLQNSNFSKAIKSECTDSPKEHSNLDLKTETTPRQSMLSATHGDPKKKYESVHDFEKPKDPTPNYLLTHARLSTLKLCFPEKAKSITPALLLMIAEYLLEHFSEVVDELIRQLLSPDREQDSYGKHPFAQRVHRATVKKVYKEEGVKEDVKPKEERLFHDHKREYGLDEKSAILEDEKCSPSFDKHDRELITETPTGIKREPSLRGNHKIKKEMVSSTGNTLGVNFSSATHSSDDKVFISYSSASPNNAEVEILYSAGFHDTDNVTCSDREFLSSQGIPFASSHKLLDGHQESETMRVSPNKIEVKETATITGVPVDDGGTSELEDENLSPGSSTMSVGSPACQASKRPPEDDCCKSCSFVSPLSNSSYFDSDSSPALSSTPCTPCTPCTPQTPGNSNVPPPILNPTWQTSAKFDRTGGVLQKEGSDVSLIVPPDAIDDTDGKHIYKAVCADTDKIRQSLHLPEDEQIASAFAEFYCCSEFKCPVSVILPHCLPPGYDWKCVTVYCVTRNPGQNITIKKIRPMQANDDCASTETLDQQRAEKQADTSNVQNNVNSATKEGIPESRKLNHAKSNGKTVEQSRENGFWQKENDNISFRLLDFSLLDYGCVEICTQHFTGFLCTYCPGRRKTIEKPRPQLFAMASADTSDDGNVDVCVDVWDQRIRLADYRQAQGIERSPKTRIQLLEDSLADSVLEMTVRGCLHHRLDGYNSGKPIYPIKQKRELHKFLACKKCVIKGRLQPITYRWALQFPPTGGASHNSLPRLPVTAKTTDVAIDVTHKNANDASKTEETTVLLKVKIPPDQMRGSNPENTAFNLSAVMQQMTGAQLAGVAHYLNTNLPCDPDLGGRFIEWCLFQNENQQLSRAIRTVLSGGQVLPSEAHQTYQKTFARHATAELRQGSVSGQVNQTPAVFPGACQPNISQTTLGSIDSRMLFGGPSTFEGYMAGAVQGQMEESLLSHLPSPPLYSANTAHMPIPGNPGEMIRLQQENDRLRQILESERQARLCAEEQLRLSAVHPNSFPDPVPCASDLSGAHCQTLRPRESDVDLKANRHGDPTASVMPTPPNTPEAPPAASNGQDQRGPVIHLGLRDSPEAITEDCILMDLM